MSYAGCTIRELHAARDAESGGAPCECAHCGDRTGNHDCDTKLFAYTDEELARLGAKNSGWVRIQWGPSKPKPNDNS